MTYSNIPTLLLLRHIEVINNMKPILTQAGLDHANRELGAIEAELDQRQPGCEFVTLLDDHGNPVGFEIEIPTA
jgi:hypothetical protein